MENIFVGANEVQGGFPKMKDGSPSLRKALKGAVDGIMERVEDGGLSRSHGVQASFTLPGGYPSAPDDLVVRIQVMKADNNTHRFITTLAQDGEGQLASDALNLEFLDEKDRDREKLRLLPELTRVVVNKLLKVVEKTDDGMSGEEIG